MELHYFICPATEDVGDLELCLAPEREDFPAESRVLVCRLPQCLS